MWYVQRNWKREITGLFAAPQPQPDGTSLTDPEPLPDDHPEIVAFLERHPVPPAFLKPLTAAEIQQQEQRRTKIEADHEAIRNAVSAFNNAFMHVETSLSALLYSCLGISKSNVAYAIYYSPTSFDARCEIVENAVIELALENESLKELIELWKDVGEALNKTRRLRNAVAHNSPNTLMIRNKAHARLTSPPFDAIRVGRPIALGQIPGLTSNEIRAGTKTALWTMGRLDEVNRVFAAFHDTGNPTLPEKLSALKRGLRRSDSQ